MLRASARPDEVTRTRHARSAALTFGLLVLFDALGFDAAPGSGARDRRPASSFVGQQDVAVAPTQIAPTENAPGRSHHPAPSAFLTVATCLPAIAARRFRAACHRSSRGSIEHFYVRRRAPPILAAAR
jgi:hypothetical protein